MTTNIKELIDATPFDLRFKLITKHKNKDFIFNSDQIRHLVKSHDDEARQVLKIIRSRTAEKNMAIFGK